MWVSSNPPKAHHVGTTDFNSSARVKRSRGLLRHNGIIRIMTQAVDELWAVARQTPHVDAETLARAIEAAVDSEPLDYRTRLLIRDGVRALEAKWGSRFQSWLSSSSK